MPLVTAAEWRHILLGFDPATRDTVRSLAEQHSQHLAEHFYRAMLEDEAASGLLSHEQVQSRLMGSMQAWIVQVLGAAPEDDLQPLVAQQIKIGEVHARLDVPVYLVLRGARRIKEGMHALLATHAPACLGSGSQLAVLVIDQAMEVMSQGYSVLRDTHARTKEAYRLFSATQNLSTVRERRRAELLDWENQCLYLHAVGSDPQPLGLLAASDFGLWFRHKGADLFQGAPEVEVIKQSMAQVDAQLLPTLAQTRGSEGAALLLQLRETARRIAMNLDALFAHHSELDAGRDVLTQLLNRKFLPVVLGKEVAFARESGATFCVLTVDIDHFKRINDSHGHEAGDMVLQQLAAKLNANIRGGDYLFRLGGEEFLMVLVDTSIAGGLRVAEKLRAQVERELFHLPQQRTLHVTLSVGVAAFDGHPDYQQVLRQSDEALYRAKAQGRNRVVAAEALAAQP